MPGSEDEAGETAEVKAGAPRVVVAPAVVAPPGIPSPVDAASLVTRTTSLERQDAATMTKVGAGALDGVAADLEILPGRASPSPTIRTPHPHDVLCGRGSRGTIHPGNVRFQALVDGHHSEYLPWIQTSLKTHIAAQIVAHIQGLDPPGRFLQRENARTGTWVEMSNDLARRKTSQALRERASELRQGVSFRPAGEKRKSMWQAADLPPPQIRKERGEESKGCPNAECKADNTNGAIWL